MFLLYISRKLASASWSLLALASIGGAAQGHHVIFPAKGPPPAPSPIYIIVVRYHISIYQRVEAAFGCRILTKGEVCDKTPFGVAGGQKGQPCVVIHFKNSNKLTIQVQARKMNVVVKGRRQAFSPEAVRALLPFLGRAVEVKTSTAT